MVSRISGADPRAKADREGPLHKMASEDRRRIDHLVGIVDQCAAAKTTAEALGEKFLAYLLAMVVEETRAAMRVQVAEAARGTSERLRSSKAG